MYTLITVNCTDQEMTVMDVPVIASGDAQTDKIKFYFCPKWDGMVKTAVFYRDGVEPINRLVDVNSEVIIPQEILKDEGIFWFGVFGVIDNKIKTSEVIKYKVKKGVITNGIEIDDPTPDIYTQLVTMIEEAEILFTRATEAEIEKILTDDVEGTGVITVSRLNQYHNIFKSMIDNEFSSINNKIDLQTPVETGTTYEYGG